MEYVLDIRCDGRRGYSRSDQSVPVVGGYGTPTCIIFVEIWELGSQDGRLQFVQPAVHADHGTHIAVPPAILAKLSGPNRECRIVRRHQAAIAKRPEILRRIEAEGCDIAPRRRQAAVSSGSMGLRAVLDHEQAGATGDAHDLAHGGRLTIQMDHDDGLGPRATRPP